MTALTDPKNVVFELVDDTPGSGLSLDEAYAFLAGADTGVFGVPKITVAAAEVHTGAMIVVADFNPHQRRGSDGRWIKLGGVSAADLEKFDVAVKKAATGRKALKAAKSSHQLAKSDPVRTAAADYYMSGGYKTLNPTLRTGKTLSHVEAVAVDRFDSMHDESPLERDVVVTRGIRDPRKIFGLAWSEDGDNAGMSWRDDALVSTTVNSDVSEWHAQLEGGNSVIMTMLVPRGIGAIHLEHETADSRQLTLERSLWYKIIRDHGRDKSGIRRLDVEVLRGGELTAATLPQLDASDISWPSVGEIDTTNVFIDDGPLVREVHNDDITVAAADTHTGAMIALLPSSADARRLALDGCEEPDQLHVTLIYLGDAADFDSEARSALTDVVRRYAAAPIEANAFAVNVFNPTGDEPCLVLGVGNGADDSLVELRSNIYSATRGLADVEVVENHTPWIPHITLAYADPVTLLALLPRVFERVGPVTFDRVRVAFGGETTDVPLRAKAPGASELTEVLDGLTSGELTLDEVVEIFKVFDWREPRGATGEWPVANSFDEVRFNSALTGGQYAALAEAYDRARFTTLTAAANDHWKNQLRDAEGQWTDEPVGALKKAIPAVIYKKHSDGAVVAVSGDGEKITWNEGSKSFILSGKTGVGKPITKKAAYDDLKKPGKWAQPSGDVSNIPVVKSASQLPSAPKKIAQKTVEQPKLSKSSVVDEKEIDDLTKKLADLSAQAKPWRDIQQAVTHKAGKGGVLSNVDLSQNQKAEEKLVEITAEAKKLADRKLALLIEREGAPWGGEALNFPKTKPHATLKSNVDKAKFGKLRDSYVVNDRQTVTHNASLRGDEPSTAAKSWKTRMNKMVNSSTLDNDAVVYRGAVLPPELVMQLKPGSTLTDKGIISTDEDLSTAGFYADTRASYIPGMIRTMFSIKVSEGTPGVDVGYGEFVFGTDSRLRIHKTELVNGEVRVFAELLPSESAKKGKK